MDWLILLTFGLTLGLGVMSGIGGGGAGFVMTPYYILIGLTPQQAIATGKMGGLGIAAGSIAAFKGKGIVNKKYLLAFLIITAICAFIAAWLLPQIDATLFQKIIGVVLILLTPTLFINKASLQPGPRTRGYVVIGFVLYTMISFGQTVIGTGIGTLLVLVMMFLFGMTALEANATKRVAQVSQAIILFVLLLAQGLVVVGHGFAAMAGSAIGGHIGSNIAIKKGSRFVKIILAVTMLASGLALVLW